jgi:hypothetical protein
MEIPDYRDLPDHQPIVEWKDVDHDESTSGDLSACSGAPSSLTEGPTGINSPNGNTAVAEPAYDRHRNEEQQSSEPEIATACLRCDYPQQQAYRRTLTRVPASATTTATATTKDYSHEWH